MELKTEDQGSMVIVGLKNIAQTIGVGTDTLRIMIDKGLCPVFRADPDKENSPFITTKAAISTALTELALGSVVLPDKRRPASLTK